MSPEVRKRVMIEYMRLKIEEQDWHAVCDSANDLREIEVEIRLAAIYALDREKKHG